jgi:hypothetical protein
MRAVSRAAQAAQQSKVTTNNADALFELNTPFSSFQAASARMISAGSDELKQIRRTSTSTCTDRRRLLS